MSTQDEKTHEMRFVVILITIFQAKPPKRILYLDAPDDVIIDRLNKRGKTSGRADDNEDSVRRRLEQAKINDAPILTAYKNQISTVSMTK